MWDPAEHDVTIHFQGSKQGFCESVYFQKCTVFCFIIIYCYVPNYFQFSGLGSDFFQANNFKSKVPSATFVISFEIMYYYDVISYRKLCPPLPSYLSLLKK